MTSAAVGLLSTYPPTQCGLATFTAALREHLHQIPRDVGVVRVVGDQSTFSGGEVVAHLVNGSPASAAGAVAQLNQFDVVVVQHEYGIYGGADGVDVLGIVEALTVPTVVVFHTVLEDPTPHQRHILARLLDLAHVAVTMTKTARQRILRDYGADPGSVVVIPHGAVDHRMLVTADRFDARPLIITWGLLGPGKGIEWAIDAMPGLRDLSPRYLVVGRTHPKVAERSGESYRDGLRSRVAALGVGDLVEFHDAYLGVEELAQLVASADVVLLPYDSREQVTSGVLIEAVAAGRPVVSTAFPHAVELLIGGAGLVVPRQDPQALQAALRRVLSEPGLAESMAAHAARTAPALVWSTVADQYGRMADDLVAAALAAAS